MSIELVNGFVCFNCTDIDLAKKGINPAKPQDDPRSLNYDPTSPTAKHAGSDSAAVKFGGALSALNGAQASDQQGSGLGGSASQQQQSLRQPGATLDITV
jgi:hypothetical protein